MGLQLGPRIQKRIGWSWFCVGNGKRLETAYHHPAYYMYYLFVYFLFPPLEYELREGSDYFCVFSTVAFLWSKTRPKLW